MATRKATQVAAPPIGVVVQNAANFTVDDITLDLGDTPMKQVTDANGIVVAILSAEDFDQQFVVEP